MNKFKEVIYTLIGLIMAVVAVPLIILALACGIVAYGAFRVVCWVVCEIDDDELTDKWNEFVTAYCDASTAAGEAFLFEMEL
jgi:hypothetical protein